MPKLGQSCRASCKSKKMALRLFMLSIKPAKGDAPKRCLLLPSPMALCTEAERGVRGSGP